MFIFRQGSHIAYLLLYVDDIILTGSSSQLLTHIMSVLSSEFSMTDLGDLHYFLGISATRSKDGMFLSQQRYANKILERVSMLNCKLPEHLMIFLLSSIAPGLQLPTPLYIAALPVHCSISRSLDRAFHMLFIRYVYICMILGNLTLLLLNVFYAIYVALRVMVFNFYALRIMTSLFTLMLIGLVAHSPIDLHPDIVFFGTKSVVLVIKMLKYRLSI